MKRPLRRRLGHLGQKFNPVRQPIGCRTTLFVFGLAIGGPVVGCAQSVPPTGPPPGVTGYALVYEDSFSTDPSNANGELQNIVNSSSAPLRPDWLYRGGTVANCLNVAGSSNVFLSGDAGGVPGLVLRDIASNPGSTNAHFPTGIQEAYQTYTCGGIISTRRLGFGYYESYASLNVSTPTPGFHTSFWTYNDGGYHVNETDVFENESIDNYTGKGFNSGIFAWNTVGGAQNPSPHPFAAWGGPNGAYSSPHAFGVLISPTNYQFYLDGSNLSSATARTAGPYVATEVWLTSVGSLDGTPDKISNSDGPWIQYDGTNSTKNYNYAFEYFKYYQQTNAQALRAQALPPGSIFIDPTVPSGGYNGSTFSAGNLKPYLSYPYNGATNPNIYAGPQGFRGQHAYTSTVAGDTATWSHVFSSSDAGSYDVFVWNASVGQYQLPGSTKVYAPDAASNTQYTLAGNVGAPSPLLIQTIPQATSGQSWIPLNSTSLPLANPTNTYAFTAGSTAVITLKVGSESSTDTQGHAFTPHTDADSVAFVPVSTFGTNSATYYSDSGFSSSTLTGWAGNPGSRYSSMPGDASAHAQWTVPLPAAGTYAVYAYTPGDSNTTTYAYYTLADGTTTLGSTSVDQSAQDNYWTSLGSYTWTGTTATVSVQNGNGSGHPANGYLRTNSIKIVPQLPADYIVCNSATGIYGANLYSTTGTWTTGSQGYSGCGGVDQTATGTGASAVYSPQVPVAGIYHAYIYADPNLADSTKVVVQSHSAELATCSGLIKNGTAQWFYLGDYFFGPDSYPGSGGAIINDSITISSNGGTVGASAIKLRYSGAIGTAAPCTNN